MARKGIIVALKGKGVVAIPIGYIVPILACFGLNGLSRKNSDPLHWIKSNCVGMLAAWGGLGAITLLYHPPEPAELYSRTIIWSLPSLTNHPMHWSDITSSIFLHPLIIVLFSPHFTSRHPAIECFLKQCFKSIIDKIFVLWNIRLPWIRWTWKKRCHSCLFFPIQ